MEKKRFKMYKKGKNWLIAPIIFLGVLSAIGFAVDNTEVHADEIETPQVQQVVEEVPVSSESLDVPAEKVSAPLSEDEVKDNPANESVQAVSEEAVLSQAELAANVAEEQVNTEAQNSDEAKNPKTEESVEVETTEPTDEVQVETATSSENTADVPAKSAATQASQPAEKQATSSSTQATTQSSPTAASRAATAKAARIAIYRVYNPNSGEHLHTMNAGERDYLVRLGWRNEGISMYVDGTGNDLYRLYNPNSGEHFYTLGAKERDNLKKHGWRYEGIAWKTPKSGQPMYRVFNPNARGAGSHHYTMLLSERNDLVKRGWRNEGIAWYTSGGSQSVASYVLLNAPYINQNSSGYPMGCEAASLLQALQKKGYAKNYNLKSFIKEMPLSSNNNPNNGFAGKPDKIMNNVYQSIYTKPLAQWGNKYGKVADISGSSVETLKDELRKGNPVVVYVTGNYAKPDYGKYWWGTGIDNAHIVTLDGFNESNNTYHISDPNSGKYWVSASKFEASYNLRKSAVVVR